MNSRAMLVGFFVCVFCFAPLTNADEIQNEVESLKAQVAKLEQRISQIDAGYRRDIAQINEQQAPQARDKDLARLERSISVLLTEIELLHQDVIQINDDLERMADLKEQVEELRAQAEQWEEKSEEYASLGVRGLGVSQGTKGSSDFHIPDFKLSGFVDGSYDYDLRSTENSFGFDQMEVNVEKVVNEVGSLRADVEWVNDGTGGFDLDVEQGYVTFNPRFINPLNLSFGKFNAPMGFEGVDAPELYQYSKAMVSEYGMPTNLTGAMLSANLFWGFDMSVYLCNGWDQNVDVNTSKTIGGRLGYDFNEWFNTGISVIHGAQSSGGDDKVTVYDWDMTFNPVSWWTVGGQVNYGTSNVSYDSRLSRQQAALSLGRSDIDWSPVSAQIDQNNAVTEDQYTHTFNPISSSAEDLLYTGDTDGEWFGFLIMNHWDYNSWGGVTLRYDYFDDKDYSRLAYWVIENHEIGEHVGRDLGLNSLKRQAFVVAPTFEIGKGMSALVEFRYDVADQKVFSDKDGDLSKTSTGIAYEMIYSF
ncbi:MAG: outer membrane beta-barrel protein [candidate division Zixibacteria bacterium]|nr:outer membrane beta-barrel protein [candidate division Zixibacteria bacterium]